MKVENDYGNLVYDTSDPLCSIEICSCQGELFAFVAALDIGVSGCRHPQPQPKRYWGIFSYNNETDSIRNILNDGGKWPQLITT